MRVQYEYRDTKEYSEADRTFLKRLSSVSSSFTCRISQSGNKRLPDLLTTTQHTLPTNYERQERSKSRDSSPSAPDRVGIPLTVDQLDQTILRASSSSYYRTLKPISW